MTLRLGWFSTGNGPGSRNLLNAVARAVGDGALDARIAVVFCNREYGEKEGSDRFIELVRSLGLDLVTLSSSRFRAEHDGELSRPGQPLASWRREYDAEVARLLGSYELEYGVLAGYMLICTEELCRRYTLLNLHPAEPGGPTGTWQEVIRTLIAAEADRSGAMMHLATPELDKGPPVAYCTFPIRGFPFDGFWAEERAEPSHSAEAVEASRLFREIRRHGAAREVPLVVHTLHAIASGRIAVRDSVVVDAAGRALPPLDLSAEIDAEVVPALSGEISGT